jgi:hypothetical protein
MEPQPRNYNIIYFFFARVCPTLTSGEPITEAPALLGKESDESMGRK